MRSGRLMGVVALTCAGCASIRSVESTTNTPLPPTVEHRVVDDSLELMVAAEVRDHEISITVEQQETCTTRTTPRVHRRRYVDRRLDPASSKLTWAVAMLGIAAGAYGTANADRLAAGSTSPESPTADEYRQYAGGLVVIGLAAATIGVIDGVRAGDSRYDDGIIDGQATHTEATCRRQVTRNRDMELRLANGRSLAGRSDEHGRVTFDFSGVSEDGVPSVLSEESLAVGAVRASVALTERQRLTLRSNLSADPTTRLATDLLQRRRDECGRSVARARALAPAGDVSRSVLSSWRAAKSDCGDVWTGSFEAELENVEARVVETECRQGLAAANEAFVDGSDVTVGEMSTALATLRDHCVAAEHVAQLAQLDAKLAQTVKRLEREAAAEARRVAREQAAARREVQERARSQRSLPAPTWPASPSRSCCRVCTTGKACGNSCIARWKTCRVGAGCACDG